MTEWWLSAEQRALVQASRAWWRGTNQLCCQSRKPVLWRMAGAGENTGQRLCPDAQLHSQVGSAPLSQLLGASHSHPAASWAGLPLPRTGAGVGKTHPAGLGYLASVRPHLQGKPVTHPSQPLSCTVNRPGCVTFPEGKTAAAGPSPGILATENWLATAQESPEAKAP